MKVDPYFDTQWTIFHDNIYFRVYLSGLNVHLKDQPVVYCHHGAGSSALTFGLFTSQLRSLYPSLAVIAVDIRCHGSTTGIQNMSNLSLSALVVDFIAVFKLIADKIAAESSVIWNPLLFVLGHSLGGSVATHLVLDTSFSLKFRLRGLIVLDMAEERALKLLATMPHYLSNTRPISFPNWDAALSWGLKASNNFGDKCHAEAVRFSLQGQLQESGNDLVWRVDLLPSQPHWEGWFTGFSKAFVSARNCMGRLLVLAEQESLDRTLMVASMRGEFQCRIVLRSGHCIQEDQSAELARIVSTFIERYCGS